MKIIYGVVFFLLLSSFASAGEIDLLANKYRHDKSLIPKQLKSSDKIKRIAIEKTGCYGTCQAYYFSVTSEGEVDYEGYEYAKFKGKRHGNIESNNLDRTFEYLNAIKYLEYPLEFGQPGPDIQFIYTLAETEHGIKVVATYGDSMPAEMWAAEKLIEDLISEVKWVKK
jgi:Domain of unknown function (DUF6438)